MYATAIQRPFQRIGARVQVRREDDARRRNGVTIDVRFDNRGEYFDIAGRSRLLRGIRVIDAQPRLRHLLLMWEQENDKHKFLCGHDERHWFVAAVPERASVSTVATAFDALKPRAVRDLEARLKVSPRMRNRRRNDAFVRQGEWFFMPVPPAFQIDPKWILRNEPISRGRGKPHICEELVRRGGEIVYVSFRYPTGVSEGRYRRLLEERPDWRRDNWTTQVRNPQVYVRGKVRHSDHKTIVLNDWHQVLMNTEAQSIAMAHVAFLD